MVVETGRTVAEVARELGLNQQTLRNWVNNYDSVHQESDPLLDVSERARLRELEKENRELRMKTEFPGKAPWAQGVGATPEVKRDTGGVAVVAKVGRPGVSDEQKREVSRKHIPACTSSVLLSSTRSCPCSSGAWDGMPVMWPSTSPPVRPSARRKLRYRHDHGRCKVCTVPALTDSRDRGRVIACGEVRSSVTELEEPAKLGGRRFPVGCELHIAEAAACSDGVELAPLVPGLDLFAGAEKHWSIRLRRPLATLTPHDVELLDRHLTEHRRYPLDQVLDDYARWWQPTKTP